ncbi:MAG: AAA family ATPase, partial [Planctomycetes bacterium]|nr:AAA family ATPase [Planctomycetota bacterium]
PLIYILSFEERRVERHLQQIAKDLNKRLLVWTVTRGLVDAATGRAEKDTDGPLAALEKVLATPPSGAFLYVLKDFHPFLDQEHRWVSDWAPTVRKLRDAAYHLLETSSSLFILSPVLSIPVELEKEITVLEFPLPDREDLTHLLARFEEEYAQRATIQLDARTHEAITGALLGLTEMEAENVICRALINDRRLDASDVSLIISEKGQIIRKSGTLEFHPLREGLEDIGGLRLLKEWLERKRFSFDESAATFGIRPPRGLLLIGVPGCGKSLTAKAIAHAWRMPLLRFDIGKVFGMWLGQSEQNMRRAIRTAEAIAPCILWIDELERGFAGVGNEWDSAATTRVFGTFITWLQEKVSPVYIVATANDVTSLPPELLRKGRFDEIFFVDLPNKHEREEVWRVHLRCRGRNAAQFDIQRLADATEGYAGADIEAVLNEGLETAHADGKRQPVTDDFLKIIRQTLPLSETMKDRIEAMRDWARTRARSASVLKD